MSVLVGFVTFVLFLIFYFLHLVSLAFFWLSVPDLSNVQMQTCYLALLNQYILCIDYLFSISLVPSVNLCMSRLEISLAAKLKLSL